MAGREIFAFARDHRLLGVVGAISANVSAVPEPGCGVERALDVGRPGWVEGSKATGARNGLLSCCTVFCHRPNP